jgi:hypothetical protein
MTNHWTTWWLTVGIFAGFGSAACGTTGNPTGLGQTTNNLSEGGGGGGSGAVSSGTDPGGGSGGGGGSGATQNGPPGSPAGGSGGSGRSSGGISDAGASPPPTPHAGNTCLKPGSPDYSQKGPYGVTKTSVDLASTGEVPDAGPTTYAIFAPTPLETNCPHPVVAWGNGTGVTGSSTSTPAGACTGTATIDCLSGTYDFFNVFAASYGIVVIASDNSNVGSGRYHKAAIDYMAKQNTDPSSPFYQKLSTRVGVSGHSQGGIGATVGAGLIGASCEAEVCVAGGGTVAKTNAFLCLTGTADQAEGACKSTFQAAPGTAFLADWDGGDHTTTETLAGYVAGQEGTHQFMHLYAAWFRCFLADDQTACKLFQGGTPSSCGICKNPGWAILSSKGL